MRGESVYAVNKIRPCKRGTKLTSSGLSVALIQRVWNFESGLYRMRRMQEKW